MTELGYALSSEEHAPADLVRYAREAEETGFSFALISDHFHPWVDSQGHSPFVWGVLGAIAEATVRLRVGTGVTCPLIRTHPAIVAQAAATAEALMPGRFFLGVGTGEALNEHITGARWPPADQRLEMLEEAIDVIRLLWQGGSQTHRGRHYTVENARIYTLPDPPPPLYVAASGSSAAELAGRAGDGLISTAPSEEVVRSFQGAADGDPPRYGQVTVCWAGDEQTARKTAREVWPNIAIAGQLSQDLPTPTHFEQAASMVSEDDVADKMALGPNPGPYVELVKKYADAGYTHVYLHQVGPDQQGFFGFCRDELLPALRSEV